MRRSIACAKESSPGPPCSFRAVSVLADLDVDALVFGDFALEAGHIDLHDLSMRALIIDVAKHAERDHHGAKQKGERRAQTPCLTLHQPSHSSRLIGSN